MVTKRRLLTKQLQATYFENESCKKRFCEINNKFHNRFRDKVVTTSLKNYWIFVFC